MAGVVFPRGPCGRGARVAILSTLFLPLLPTVTPRPWLFLCEHGPLLYVRFPPTPPTPPPPFM